MSCREGYRNTSECQRVCLRFGKFWDLGIFTSDRRYFYPAIAESAVAKEASQWCQDAFWSMRPLVQTHSIRTLTDLQNNADEGPLFVPQNIISEEDFVDWLQLTFPLFTNDDISKVLLYYPSTNASVDPSAVDYATSGYTGATALNESTFGSGQQQRADVRIILGYQLSSKLRWLIVTAERLCRNYICLPLVLARGSFYRQWARSLQVSILRHWRSTRLGRGWLLWARNAKSRT